MAATAAAAIAQSTRLTSCFSSLPFLLPSAKKLSLTLSLPASLPREKRERASRNGSGRNRRPTLFGLSPKEAKMWAEGGERKVEEDGGSASEVLLPLP